MASRQVEGRDEFLVASIGPLSLARIRGDELTRADQLWIGDHGAFEAYQRHFHEPSGMAQQTHAETAEMEAFLAEVAGTAPELPSILIALMAAGGRSVGCSEASIVRALSFGGSGTSFVVPSAGIVVTATRGTVGTAWSRG